MENISDSLKIDVGFQPLSRTSGDSAGEYFPMDKYRKALYCVECAAVAASYAVVAQVMQATNAAAGGAKVITNAAATITANSKCSKVTLTLSGATTGNVVTINGLVFTAGASTVLASRQWDASGNDDADAVALALCINDATYGVPGVLATAETASVVLTAIEPGEQYITIADPTGTIVPSTQHAVSFIEVDAAMLDTANGFDHIALRITTTSTVLVAATLIRSCRYTPDQYVAGSKTDVA